MSEPLRFLLQREKPGPERTLGEWRWRKTGERLFYTMEPGDADAAGRMPPGFKHAVPHGWEAGSKVRYPRTYAFIGDDCSHQPEEGIPHAARLVHWGSFDENTVGCTLIGLSRGMLKGEPALLDSKKAVLKLATLVGNRDFYLTVREFNG